MGCKAAVQALQKADALKAKVSRNCDLLNDSQAWTDQQQLQMVYHQVLVLDLEYALDKKVEQELWTFGFKNHITVLQEQARDKKNPHRSDSQALLSWCLEAASGFYLTLLQELCTAFNLDLPFRKQLSIYGQAKPWTTSEQLNPPQASSCIYICQYCLVHLGDIARYRNQRKQAESFYKHAILLSPTSGQPYNQLALLEASQGDKLATIFYYVRGIAVKNPFPATATNLANTLSLAIDKDDPITEVQTKLTVNELIRMFVKVHGLLYTATDLPQAELGVKTVNATLTPLVATQSFSEQKLIQMTVINLYALKHTVGAGTLKTDELTEDETEVRRLVLDLLAGSLSAFLLPVYTLSHDFTLLDYCALPAIKFILYWLKQEPEVLNESVFQIRLQIWPGLCKLLNSLQTHLNDFDYEKFVKVPLSEDKDLQGFLPLSRSLKEFDFKGEEVEDLQEHEKLIRAKRLIELGLWLTNVEVNNTKLIVIKENSEEKTIFEPGSVQPDPTTKLLEEMKSFNVTETLPVIKLKGTEKRGGILKPQGSLEKSRKEQEAEGRVTIANVPLNKADAKLKRVGQNVALQSIFKMEENKQVKFDIAEKQKLPKVETKPPVKPQPPTYLSQQFRPLFDPPPKPPTDHQDYLKNPFQSYSNGAFERNAIQSSFLKSDGPMGNMNIPNISQNVNFSLPPPQNFFNNPLMPSPNSFSSNMQRPQITQPLPMPYQQSLPPFSQSHEFNAWKPEERPPSTWWSNANQPLAPNYQRDFPINHAYNMPYGYNMEFNKPQAMNSPWNSMQNNISSSHSFDQSSQGLSLRQAMLKETKNIMPMPNETEKIMQVPSNTPGYSLFNSSSWSPSLPGQFRNTESPSEGLMNNLRQQSLLSRQAPLQQLLERQNQLKKGDS